MRVLVACKRGQIAPRDKWGHCLCAPCKAAKKASQKDRSAYKKAWQAANPDKQKAYATKWKEANREKRRATVQAWRKANPEKVAAMNQRGGKKWASNNKGHRLAIVRARQLAKRQRTPAWADKVAIRAVYQAAASMTAKTGIPHEVDHEFPLQGELVSGLHVAENLRVITRTENRRKGAKLCAA